MAVVKTTDKNGLPLTVAEADNNMEELDKKPFGQAYPKQSGIGLKLRNTPDSEDETFGFHDLMGKYYDIPLNPAVMSIYKGGIYQKQFEEGKKWGVDFHLPHDYALGTDIFVHVHWSHNSAVVTGGSATWKFEASYSKGHNQEVFGNNKLVALVQDANTNAYFHQIAETAMSVSGGSSTNFDTDALEVDGNILSTLSLDSNDIETSNASVVNPFVHHIDIHYQSTGLATINRNPDFYGA